MMRERIDTPWVKYGVCSIVVGLACFVRWAMDQPLGSFAPYATFYAAVLFSAWWGGLRPALFALVVGFVCGTYLFVQPRYTLSLPDRDARVHAALYFFVGSAIALLGGAMHAAKNRAELLVLEAITRQKQLEHEIATREQAIADRRRVEQALRDADRRKNEFLAMLGHELRNPLASILYTVQVLRKIGGQNSEATELRDLIERSSLHMTRLIDELLDTSRISQGKVSLRTECLDLVQLIRQAVEDHRYALQQNGLSLTLELPESAVAIQADAVRLSQVIGNLLHNAAKFTDAGGQVAVRLRVSDDRQHAVVEVSDTGIGMEPGTMDTAFEAFTQARTSSGRDGNGLGLGLSLVKGLVELHGGTVEAHSDGPGRGSTFSLTLPLDIHGELPKRVEAGGPASKASACRVLIIDDSPAVSRSLSMLLRASGHTVAVAADGPSGVEQARQFLPDVVLCDISMPGTMDGYAVARTLRSDAATKSIFLVAVTGFGQDDDRRLALAAGFDRHLSKPVVDTVLDALLAEVTERRLPTTAG
jgi:signal transduction histidine kinase/ActR/RegA family two-component response regulator